MSKKDRLKSIIDLIDNFEISTQEELTDRLKQNGYKVSQATVSRDINELNLIKVECDNNRIKYVKPNKSTTEISSKILELFKHITLSIDYANNLIVVKTLSGNAASAGMAVDEMHLPDILGTVAGDDTLLIIARSTQSAQVIVKILRNV